MLLQLVEPGQTPLPHQTKPSLAIGIDLGTTHSLVAVSEESHPKILRDERGEALLPSIVSHTPRGREVGERDAFGQGVSSFKKFMGKSHEGEKFKLGDQPVTPIELSADVLKCLKQRAEKYLGTPVTQAVITVPAYFDDVARTETREAARLAGLEVLRLVNEPTAAALAYGLEHGAQGIYAIYDFGGGTFDLSLLNLEGEIFKVLATGGDTQLGGEDMDEVLLTFLLGNTHPSDQDRSRLLAQTRQIKEHLTTHDHWSGSLVMEEEAGEIPCRVGRSDFERLVSPLVEKTLKICRQVIRDAQIPPGEIKGIVLVGGTTRIPLVQEKVKEFFGQAPLTNINPDEVVALGAALQAEALTQGSQRLLLDVTPLSLGLETYGGLAEKIIPRNSPIPAVYVQDFTTFQDNQTGIEIHIVQGERELTKECRSLGHFTLKGIPPMKAGTPRIRVTFTLDADGILSVSAQEQTTHLHYSLEVKPGHGLSEQDLLRMIEDGYGNAQKDMEERLLREAVVEAEHLLHQIKEILAQETWLLHDQQEKDQIEKAMEALSVALSTLLREDIKNKTEHLEKVTNSLAERRLNYAINTALKGQELDSLLPLDILK